MEYGVYLVRRINLGILFIIVGSFIIIFSDSFNNYIIIKREKFYKRKFTELESLQTKLVTFAVGLGFIIWGIINLF